MPPELPANRTSNQNLTRVKFGCIDNMRGKTIAITGAARGIGYATAKALLARGTRAAPQRMAARTTSDTVAPSRGS
jgi:hypothetical protein